MDSACKFFHDSAFLDYCFGDEHPFHPKRLQLTIDLIQAYDLLKPEQITEVSPTSDELLELVHDRDYIEAVKKASVDSNYIPTKYGIGTDDTPTFPNMHDTTAKVVGGTLQAAIDVMEGKCRHAVNLAGGLHHSFSDRASGFCIYNDAAVAIKHLKDKYNARVLYLDTDAHHGDGVQSIFYDDPDVMTVSFHETGKYLFPGTGHIYERGTGEGLGFTYNIPLEPFTESDSFLEGLNIVLPELVASFKPDIIISQNGCDAHYLDPLTHLYSKIDIFHEIPKLVHNLAHEYCAGRWVAIGGGGYDMWRVVPRAWTLIWATMLGVDISDKPLPDKWLNKWQSEAPVKLPKLMQDPLMMYENVPRKPEIDEKNLLTYKKVMHKI